MKDIVREKIIAEVLNNPYLEYGEHRDLSTFCVCGESFLFDGNDDGENEVDFNEVVVVVEKDWLFEYMRKNGIDNPLEYLQTEYTSDDSREWYDEAIRNKKVIMVDFS